MLKIAREKQTKSENIIMYGSKKIYMNNSYIILTHTYDGIKICIFDFLKNFVVEKF